MKDEILIIEDDESISEMVALCLTKEGYRVKCVHDGLKGLNLVDQEVFQLVILDLMLPGIDGFEILKQLRTKSHVPVLIMSAKDSDVDKALGLGFGADDYITKPFSLIELTARVKASLRRASVYVQSVPQTVEVSHDICIGNLVIQKETFGVKKDGDLIQLTLKEFGILELLAEHPQRVFTKAQIYEHVWGEAYFGDENVVNVQMRRLREKIEDNPSKPRYVTTVWGIGYRLGEEVG